MAGRWISKASAGECDNASGSERARGYGTAALLHACARVARNAEIALGGNSGPNAQASGSKLRARAMKGMGYGCK